MPSPEQIVARPPLEVVAGVVRADDGRWLITQRLAKSELGGYWEFPGGKVEAGEDRRAALRRELKEELGIETEIGAEIHRNVHTYPDREVHLYFFQVCLLAGAPQKLEVADFRWVTIEELRLYPFPEANFPLLQQLRGASAESC
jgi:8-oxo-dGTP diphosphatase